MVTWYTVFMTVSWFSRAACWPSGVSRYDLLRARLVFSWSRSRLRLQVVFYEFAACSLFWTRTPGKIWRLSSRARCSLWRLERYAVFKMAVENVRSETSSLNVEQHIRDRTEGDALFNVIQTILAVCEKALSALQWTLSRNAWGRSGRDFPSAVPSEPILDLRSVASCWNSLFFSELFSRSEGLHAEFACLICGMLSH